MTEGQFDIGNSTDASVTFDGDYVVLTHVRAGDDADLEITIFSATNPDEASDHVVVREPARALNTDTRDDFRGRQSPTVVFPL
ncbi:hypothetical protein [Corynebacterium sputi]|uniref:hypothetical protein n=1 Tax=Corynebacterium sputi TaxID=489915 RepID=UPI0003F8548C|nr:hypothetical protein [Corynebacterium sputi]